MSELFETAIVEKRNVLNELRSNNMTLQELRFFSIYLSKINPYDVSTRVVSFPLDDFRKIMGLGKLNIGQLRASTDSLLTKIVHIPSGNGGFTAFQLFKECTVDQDINGQWYVSIDAHDKALPLMFDFKDRYFKYELWNALRLKSPNQVRMYEILKQYENLKKREIAITELRELLGIAKDEYTYWQNFKVRVLDSCQQALKELTDICFTYERGKAGKGGKWLTIIFHIKKNTEYVDPLTLSKFIGMQPSSNIVDTNINDEAEEMTILGDCDDIDYGSRILNELGDICNFEFNREQMVVLKDLITKAVVPEDALYLVEGDYRRMGQYLFETLHKMDVQKSVKNRFAYLCRMIENDIAKHS